MSKTIKQLNPIRMQVTRDQNEKIQEAIFAKGGAWANGGKDVVLLDNTYFICLRAGKLTRVDGDDYAYFMSKECSNGTTLLHPHDALELINACENPVLPVKEVTPDEMMAILQKQYPGMTVKIAKQ